MPFLSIFYYQPILFLSNLIGTLAATDCRRWALKSMNKEEYLKLEYQEALNHIRTFLDSRYKILQFVGFFNAAIITFGFGQGVITIKAASMATIFICILSVSVSILALATEFSLIQTSITTN